MIPAKITLVTVAANSVPMLRANRTFYGPGK